MASLGGGIAAGLGAGAVGGAVVRLLLDDAQFQAGLTKDEAQFKGASAQMGASATRFGGAAKAGFAVAGLAAATFVASSVKAYSDHQQVVSQLQQTIERTPQLVGESTQAFEDQATALQSLTGYQDEEVLKADNVLARFKLTGPQIRQLIPLVLDYARATGQDAATAATGLGRAMLGNTRALKTIGVNFTATGDTAKDFATIMDLVKGKVGGVAQTFGKTAAGQLEIAKAKFDDVKEAVGAQLVPVLTQLLGVAQSLLPVLSGVAENVKGLFLALIAYKALNFLPKLFGDAGAGLKAFTGPLSAAIVIAEGLSAAIDGLVKGFEVELQEAAKTGGDALIKMRDEVVSLDKALNNDFLQGLIQDLHPGLNIVTHGVDDMAGAANRSVAAFREHQQTLATNTRAANEVTRSERLLVGGITAAVKKQQDLNTATNEVTQAERRQAAVRKDAQRDVQALSRFFGTEIGSLKQLKSAWAGWKDSATQNLNFVSGALQDFAGKSHVHVQNIITDFQKNAKEMQQFGTDLETIRRRGGKAADGLVQSLLNMGEQGAGAARAIASANDQQFGKVLGTWNRAGGAARSFAGQLESAIVGGFRRVEAEVLVAMGKFDTFKAALAALNGQKANVYVVTHYETVGSPPAGSPAGAHAPQIGG